MRVRYAAFGSCSETELLPVAFSCQARARLVPVQPDVTGNGASAPRGALLHLTGFSCRFGKGTLVWGTERGEYVALRRSIGSRASRA